MAYDKVMSKNRQLRLRAAEKPYVADPVLPNAHEGDLRNLSTVRPWQPGQPVRVVKKKKGKPNLKGGQ
jgi:hypothetical protein